MAPGSAKTVFTAFDFAMMARAIRLAEQGRGIATPNPHVGCVIVNQGRIIGEGFTQAGGRPHAEAMALAQCGGDASGATVYSTLEPCSLHAQSRGPACADLLVAAQVGRVVSALHDPFEGVNGAGHRQLQNAGIQLDVGLMEDAAKHQLRAFLSRINRQRPWVTIKAAASLDGRTALANGQSQWITGEAARRDVHRLRAEACAVMTGIGTALADDPQLTVRNLPGGLKPQRQPLRILLDSRLEARDSLQLLHGGNTLIVTASDNQTRIAQLRDRDVDVLTVDIDTAKGKVDLPKMMRALASRGINHVLVESGAKLNGSLLAAGEVDELILYQAPHLLGDRAQGLFALPELKELSQRHQLRVTDQRMVGADWRISAEIIQQL